MTAGYRRVSRVPTWGIGLIVAIFLLFGFLTSRAGRIQYGSAQTTFPIVAFEVAGGGARAEQILSETVDALTTADADTAAVRVEVETAVRESLWWDFGFILGYSFLIFILAPVLGRKAGPGPWERLGVVTGWSGLMAGLLDIIENASLFQVLEDTSREGWAQVAAVVSWGKWVIVAAAVVYALFGVIRWGARSWARPRTDQG